MNLLRETPRSVLFRKEREPGWRELDALVTKALGSGLGALTPNEALRLPVLYRVAVSSLLVARKTAMDRELVRYLEALCSRAYVVVYGTRRPARSVVFDFLFQRFPAAVRALWAELALTTMVFGTGVGVGWALFAEDSAWYYAFVDAGLAGDRTPAASDAALREVIYAKETEGLGTFASFLFTHNTRIGLLSFVVGLAAGVPTLLLTFSNGLMLGAFLGLYASRGMLVPLLGWLLPHGIPEITALLLCGAAGLSLGRSVLFPGQHGLRHSLAERGRTATVVVAGAVILFCVAGLFEGILRQLLTLDEARFVLAAFNGIWLLAWLAIPRFGAAEWTLQTTVHGEQATGLDEGSA